MRSRSTFKASWVCISNHNIGYKPFLLTFSFTDFKYLLLYHLLPHSHMVTDHHVQLRYIAILGKEDSVSIDKSYLSKGPLSNLDATMLQVQPWSLPRPQQSCANSITLGLEPWVIRHQRLPRFLFTPTSAKFTRHLSPSHTPCSSSHSL